MTEQEIFQVPVPKATESYSPVPHKQIVDEIQQNVDRSGLTISNKAYRVARDGQKLIGLMDLEAESAEFNYRLAFRNSYDKSMSVAFVGGTSVMICSNGMVVGDIKFIRKHTGAVATELAEKIQQVIGGLETDLVKATRHAEQMRSIELDRTATAELCGRLFMEQDIITSSQLNIVRQQLENPDYDEFSDPTLWSLYNHATHALKETHPVNYVDKYKELHDFVEAEYQLK